VAAVPEPAAPVIVFPAPGARHVAAVVPQIASRVRVIPQSVDLDVRRRFDLDTRWPLPSDRVLFLFPAGIRPVKNPLAPIEPLARLAARDARVRLAYAGPRLAAGGGGEAAPPRGGRGEGGPVGRGPGQQAAPLPE